MPSKKPLKDLGQAQSAEDVLAHLPDIGDTDTTHALMEVYESIERSYRAAMTVGTSTPRVSSSTSPS